MILTYRYFSIFDIDDIVQFLMKVVDLMQSTASQ